MFQLPDEWVRKNFSITEWKLKKDLEGVPKIKLDEFQTKKSDCKQPEALSILYSDIDNIKERISNILPQVVPRNCVSKVLVVILFMLF